MATVWSKKSFKKEEDKDLTSTNTTTSLLNIMETQKVRFFSIFISHKKHRKRTETERGGETEKDRCEEREEKTVYQYCRL